METSKIDAFVRDPRAHALFAVLKAMRNAAIYGSQVELFHSLGNAVFFSKEPSWIKKIISILQKCWWHSKDLAIYAILYKLLSLRLTANNFKLRPGIAAFVASLAAFSQPSPMSIQICLYMLCRNMWALSDIAREKYFSQTSLISNKTRKLIERIYWPLIASTSWAIAAEIFESSNRKHLPNALRSSMLYLFEDSEQFDSLETVFLKNKK